MKLAEFLKVYDKRDTVLVITDWETGEEITNKMYLDKTDLEVKDIRVSFETSRVYIFVVEKI